MTPPFIQAREFVKQMIVQLFPASPWPGRVVGRLALVLLVFSVGLGGCAFERAARLFGKSKPAGAGSVQATASRSTPATESGARRASPQLTAAAAPRRQAALSGDQAALRLAQVQAQQQAAPETNGAAAREDVTEDRGPQDQPAAADEPAAPDAGDQPEEPGEAAPDAPPLMPPGPPLRSAAPQAPSAADQETAAPAAPPSTAVQPRRARSEPRIDPSTRFVSFNFDNADIYEFIQVVSEITGLNYVIAPGVGGKVTIETAGKISIDEVFELFITILEVNNLTAVKSGNVYKILPIGQARQTRVESEFGREPKEIRPIDKVVTRVLPLTYISANKISEILKPFLSKNGDIRIWPPRNLLIIVDLASNIQSLIDLIDIFDVDTFEEVSLMLLPVKNLKAADLAKELENVYKALGIEKLSTGGGVEFLSIERMNSILLLASTPELLRSIERLAQRLDIVSDTTGLQTFVYYVEHRKATELASLLTELYSSERTPQAPEQREERRPQPAAQQQERALTPLERAAERRRQRREARERRQEPAPAQPSESGLRSATEAPVRIIADETANALIVQATPNDYQLIQDTIRKLDLRPKQVLLEMLLLEITLSDDLEFGLQVSQIFAGGVSRKGGNKFVDFRGQLATAFPGLEIPRPGGLAFNFVESPRLNLLLNALASNSRIKVLSHPHLLASNNKQASINVGAEVPIVTGETTTDVTGVAGQQQVLPVVDRNVQFRQTGVTLTFTPSINANNLVTLELDQEFSTPQRTVTSGIDAPTFLTRRAKSTIVVQDRNTVTLAGLISENESATDSKVPLLGDIPFLGRLFRRTTKNTERTELVVLITPRVVETVEDAANLITEFEHKVDALKEQIEKSRQQNVRPNG